MKKLALFALLLIALAPVVSAQTATSFTGKWEGTITMTTPDGTPRTQPAEFNLTQKGNVLTGTAGPPSQQQEISKGVVKAGTATFEVQPPNGSPYKFTLTIVKGRLQGEMAGDRTGTPMTAKIDAAKAKPAK
jgi:hypothetical protein